MSEDDVPKTGQSLKRIEANPFERVSAGRQHFAVHARPPPLTQPINGLHRKLGGGDVDRDDDAIIHQVTHGVLPSTSIPIDKPGAELILLPHPVGGLGDLIALTYARLSIDQ